MKVHDALNQGGYFGDINHIYKNVPDSNDDLFAIIKLSTFPEIVAMHITDSSKPTYEAKSFNFLKGNQKARSTS